LEIGCGLGWLAENLKDAQLVVETDIHMPFLKAVREKFQGNKSVRIEELDIIEPDQKVFNKLKNMHLDTAICINTLEHISNDRQAIKEYLSIIISRGQAAFICSGTSFSLRFS